MCDTIVTIDGETGTRLFAKNSDRYPSEPQLIQYVHGEEGLDVPTQIEHRSHYDRTQYAQIRQAARLYSNPLSALISRPAWIWGAEMGVNEAGVAIGNEAVFARRRVERRGLLGMDMLRLALHNAHDGAEALGVLTHLMESFGQGGNGSYEGTLKYHNSFLISDAKEAYLLESAGRQWESRRIGQHHTISNSYSIPEFSRIHASKIHLLFTKGESRRKRSLSLVGSSSGSVESMKTILRDNLGMKGPMDHSMGSICMDSTGFVKSRTMASMVVSYRNGKPLAWMTGSPLPNFSPFLPFPLDERAFKEAPHQDIAYSYRFAKERMELLRHILIAPVKAQERIGELVKETEAKCSVLLEECKDPTEASIACLVEEQSYRIAVRKVLVEFGAESKNLYEKPDGYYRCG
jgi:hypothetical protein